MVLVLNLKFPFLYCILSDSNNNYQLPQFEEDLAPQDRIRMISQIYLGDVNIPVPKLTRKVL